MNIIILLLGLVVILQIALLFLFVKAQNSKKNAAQESSQSTPSLGAYFSHLQKIMSNEFSQNRKESDHKSQQQRHELSTALQSFAENIRKFGQESAEQQTLFRDLLDKKMDEMRQENRVRLNEMRKTVDEHLQTALEKRLTESFKTVADHLEAVHKGLGEMKNLAVGVGDLKNVLTNVKSRGGFGEMQLKILIEDFLTADQFVENLDCGKNTSERVEFGVLMPGSRQNDGDRGCYLPVDSKFPLEDYQRLLNAWDAGLKPEAEKASLELEKRIKRFAKDIKDKYVNPPFTTEWAILFLPTEGLFAEILRRPGLFSALQQDFQVTVAGPTNFQTLLLTFRMGFRHMALQDRADEVWDTLAGIKKEFAKFEEQVVKVRKSLEVASNHVDGLETRNRVLGKKLQSIDDVSPAVKSLQDNNHALPLS